jgi:hypothetical protein
VAKFRQTGDSNRLPLGRQADYTSRPPQLKISSLNFGNWQGALSFPNNNKITLNTRLGFFKPHNNGGWAARYELFRRQLPAPISQQLQ